VYLIFWIVLGIALSVAEIFIPTFFLFWFGLGAFAAAVVSIFYGLIVQLIVFIVVSALLLIFTRPIAVKMLLRKEPPEKINIDAIVGKRAEVVKRIDPAAGTGMVRINGELWRAVTEDNSVVEVDNQVLIRKINGTKLVVKKIS